MQGSAPEQERQQGTESGGDERGITEKRGGDARPLPHPHRERPDPLVRHGLQAGKVDDIPHPPTRHTCVYANAMRWLDAERPGCTALASTSTAPLRTQPSP